MSFLDMHRVTPLLGEPGLLIRSDRFSLVDEADGRSALVQIERASSGSLWKVSAPSGIGFPSDSLPTRFVDGWAEAMSSAVELASLVRAFLHVSGQRHEAESQLREWSRDRPLAQSPSTR